MEKMDLNKNNLKKFGITMGMAFLIIALILVIRHKHNLLPLFSLSIAFFILAFTLPVYLNPVYILWMRLAFILGWINTRLLLLVIFYLVFTPIGLVIKIFRADLLDRRIDRHQESYWRAKEEVDFKQSNYERQF
jgi:membrane-associated phospholipid phosphatase